MKCQLAIIICAVCAVFGYDLTAPTGPTVSVRCDENRTGSYIRIGHKYYFISDSKVSWFESAHLCRQFGGDLALIESDAEMKAISNYLMSNGYDERWLWISGNDLVKTHQFQSINNGLPLEFTSWSVGQPDYPNIEQCVHLWLRDGAFRMNNWVCTEKAYYICERQNYTRCRDIQC